MKKLWRGVRRRALREWAWLDGLRVMAWGVLGSVLVGAGAMLATPGPVGVLAFAVVLFGLSVTVVGAVAPVAYRAWVALIWLATRCEEAEVGGRHTVSTEEIMRVIESVGPTDPPAADRPGRWATYRRERGEQ